MVGRSNEFSLVFFLVLVSEFFLVLVSEIRDLFS
jgi:hypothetical protein